jgi:hypothetical protein
MSLLTDDDKALLVLEHLGPAALAGDTMSLYDCFQLALDVAEKAILAKLASAELPEPVSAQFQTLNKFDWHNFIDAEHQANTEEDGRWPIRYLFTADQLRQAYAQGAASQLAEKPTAWMYPHRMGHFELTFTDQAPIELTYPHFAKSTPLFTLKEPK